MAQSKQPLDIHCSSCGAPAKFDITSQCYRCQYCGSETGIREPLAEQQGFRALHRETLKKTRENYALRAASCTGCGAEVVFQENEALTNCAFCGRSLVRKEYLDLDGFPELLIPFRIEEADAKARLLAWCDGNRARPEARQIRKHIGEMQGFYLPFELLKGPADCQVQRSGSDRSFTARGFLEGSFVNASAQLNNLLLDGTEPYDLAELREFDFSFLAGHCVKIQDIDREKLDARVREEIAADWEPSLSKPMETRAIDVKPSTGNLLELSAVLPAYYLRAGNTLAAVNGQTGKVAVREAKDRFLLPWWIKPILGTILFSALIYAVTVLFHAEPMGSLLITGMMAVFLLIVLFTAYHNVYQGEKRHLLRRRIFTSDSTRPTVEPPEFYEDLGEGFRQVRLRFSTPLRVLKMLGIAVGVVFLPLILAFLFNGLSARGLTIGGAAVWLCITVPIAPVYLLKFGRLDLYQHPLIYVFDENGSLRRWRPQRVKRSLSDLVKAVGDFFRGDSLGILIGIGIALIVLIINVVLVLHWDQY